MKRTYRFTAVALAAAFGIGIMSAPIAARASEEGKRNTAIALGAAAAGLLLTQKNKLHGLVAAGAAAYAYKQYDDSVKDRHRREREYGYDRYNDRYSNRDDYRYNDRYNNRDDYRYNDRYNNSSDYRYHRNDTYNNRYNTSDYRYDRYNADRDCPRNDDYYNSRAARSRSTRRR